MDKLNYSLEKNKILEKKAKSLIPGGGHTYSKGADQFPSNAPSIIDHGKGCHLFDVDGNKFLDLGMSLGTVILGHAYEPVLDAVRKELVKGVNFVRPSIIEGQLAEKIIDIVPSAEMVKFAKNGSDATTAAVKLARAYTGREHVVRCQNDAFNAVHDWFIGSTIMDSGVPKCVRDLTLQFEYNNIESLKILFDLHPGKIACVLLEPVSMIEPKEGFLESVKKLCEDNGAILIFDEVVSGFRFSLGGAQEMVKVKPHLTALGKAMANGFSVSALVGQKEIMRLGGIDHDRERVFLLSTTHGGETHSLAASLATINEIEKYNIIDHFWKIGKRLQDGVKEAAISVGAEKYVDVFGYPCKPGFGFKDHTGEFSMAARTLFLQETAARGVLIPYVVPSFSHKEEDIDVAIEVIKDALVELKDGIENNTLMEKIQCEIVKPVFRKYN
jgi:glutamate-1-semialdehyde 2,1-aminomutase